MPTKPKKVLYSLKHLHIELKRRISGLGQNAMEQGLTALPVWGQGWGGCQLLPEALKWLLQHLLPMSSSGCQTPALCLLLP